MSAKLATLSSLRNTCTDGSIDFHTFWSLPEAVRYHYGRRFRRRTQMPDDWEAQIERDPNAALRFASSLMSSFGTLPEGTLTFLLTMIDPCRLTLQHPVKVLKSDPSFLVWFAMAALPDRAFQHESARFLSILLCLPRPFSAAVRSLMISTNAITFSPFAYPTSQTSSGVDDLVLQFRNAMYKHSPLAAISYPFNTSALCSLSLPALRELLVTLQISHFRISISSAMSVDSADLSESECIGAISKFFSSVSDSTLLLPFPTPRNSLHGLASGAPLSLAGDAGATETTRTSGLLSNNARVTLVSSAVPSITTQKCLSMMLAHHSKSLIVCSKPAVPAVISALPADLSVCVLSSEYEQRYGISDASISDLIPRWTERMCYRMEISSQAVISSFSDALEFRCELANVHFGSVAVVDFKNDQEDIRDLLAILSPSFRDVVIAHNHRAYPAGAPVLKQNMFVNKEDEKEDMGEIHEVSLKADVALFIAEAMTFFEEYSFEMFNVPSSKSANAGFSKTHQFIALEESEQISHVHVLGLNALQNVAEAEYAVLMVLYSLLLGYAIDDFAIVTLFPVQKRLIREVWTQMINARGLGKLLHIKDDVSAPVYVLDEIAHRQFPMVVFSITRTIAEFSKLEVTDAFIDVFMLTDADLLSLFAVTKDGLYIVGAPHSFQQFVAFAPLRALFDDRNDRPSKLEIALGEVHPTARNAKDPGLCYNVDSLAHLSAIVDKMIEDRR
eukprot:ANDGO_02862.mRNA.1 hypothetical protein GUITHDRAFT_114807